MDKKELKQLDKNLVNALNDKKLLAFQINELGKIENEIKQLRLKSIDKANLINKFTCYVSLVDLDETATKEALLFKHLVNEFTLQPDVLSRTQTDWLKLKMKKEGVAFKLDKNGDICGVVAKDDNKHSTNSKIEIYGATFYSPDDVNWSKETKDNISQELKTTIERIVVKASDIV